MAHRRLAFVHGRQLAGLEYPESCPFRTSRAALTRQRLLGFGLLGTQDRQEVPARLATEQELLQFHEPAYLEALQQAAAGDLTAEGFQRGLGGVDTPVFPAMYEYARWAVAAGLTAADLLLAEEAEIAFNLWGGFHHAHAGRAGGFCYLNDVVLTCMHLAQAGWKVFCLDVDAHHGDGTQAAFYSRADVFTLSVHESGRTLYPWGGWETEIGEGKGEGFNGNLGLPAGSHDALFLRALDEFALPLLDAFDPDVIVVELGMDTLAGDPLTHLQMTNNICPELAQRLLARRRPLLIIGGGGYHVENTVRAWALAWASFAGEDQPEELQTGLGGVFLGSSEWLGGLRDPRRPVDPAQAPVLEREFTRNLQTARQVLFPRHGLRLDVTQAFSEH